MFTFLCVLIKLNLELHILLGHGKWHLLVVDIHSLLITMRYDLITPGSRVVNCLLYSKEVGMSTTHSRLFSFSSLNRKLTNVLILCCIIALWSEKWEGDGCMFISIPSFWILSEVGYSLPIVDFCDLLSFSNYVHIIAESLCVNNCCCGNWQWLSGLKVLKAVQFIENVKKCKG